MDIDFDLDIPPPPKVVPYGMKSHPMYQQWLKMIDSCVDKNHKLYPQVGAKGITVMDRWFDFSKFVEDNEDLFEDEPSKPANLRCNFIRRKNLKAGFNPRNIEWVPKKDALAIQPNTLCVDTHYGKNMPIKQLADLLAEKASNLEDLPPEAPAWTQWRWVIDEATDRKVRRQVRITTVPAIKLHELRKRARMGLTGWDLLTPVREYGTDRIEDERETLLCDRLDAARKPITDDAPYYVKNRGYW